MKNHDKCLIINIVRHYLPTTQIFLFGSRARQDNIPQSDIDIVLDDNNAKIDPTVINEIKEALEESTLPFTVDIVDLNNISQDFKKNITKDMILWQ